MSESLSDHAARERFRGEWARNFAVSANAGSGKTTAISERLSAMALAEGGADLLRKTAVVTFTKKAAAQIGQRARAVLLRQLAATGRTDLSPLDSLERAFFGTIHSFCLLLARRYGQTLGIHLNPAVVEGAEMEDALWEEFLEQDPMQFTVLSPPQVEGFLRHVPLDAIFELARQLDRGTAERLKATSLSATVPEPSAAVLAGIMAARSKGRGAESLAANQELAQQWLRRFRNERGFLPLPKPQGTAAGIVGLYAAFLAPVKSWLADAGAMLAAELALRYRAWRFDRGVQTYADQVEAALAVLQDSAILERIRQEGWRVLLDEAQDTDPLQLAVLVEITRPPGAPLGTWPGRGGVGPRAGHFSLVGDGQQSIYSSRADVRNFQRHVDAFEARDGGEKLVFDVTFRAPRVVIDYLNTTLPAAFGAARIHNNGLPPADGARAPLLQVPYERLAAGPVNDSGLLAVLPLQPAAAETKVDQRLAHEVRQIAAWLRHHGPAAVGARHWGEICLLAPRNDWLVTARRELEAAGLKTALQMRKNRNGDNPVYAWLTGLLTAVCDPENIFEWVGVLRELFAVSDGQLAVALVGPRKFEWDAPEKHAEPLRAALATLKPFVERVDREGEPLERFAHDLVEATRLVDKARRLDPRGGLVAELEGLLAGAADLSVAGAGPRAWRCALLDKLESGRPAGKASEDALNLLTAHSAKGLEWPVVIPLGLWRGIGKRTETGLRLLPGETGDPLIFFDNASLSPEIRESRERERQRELVRLLYVTLTRARRALVLPLGEPGQADSFLDLWGADLTSLPRVSGNVVPAQVAPTLQVPPVEEQSPVSIGEITFPRRVLPHQLAQKPDHIRSLRHESAGDEAVIGTREDPLEYGVWWHETVEFVPWAGSQEERRTYLAAALEAAEKKGFGTRAARELELLQRSQLWAELISGEWRVFAELSVVAPLGENQWVDGVIDLVAQRFSTGELRIVDWKTNQRRGNEEDQSVLERLKAEYRPQLQAYANCLGSFFPKQTVTWAVYSTVVGAAVSE
jgi:ATP-dependent exoDNAse (exonuclease V) beta subunit